MLGRIDVFVTEHKRFPTVHELGDGKITMRSSVIRKLNRLESAGLVLREGSRWKSCLITDRGRLQLRNLSVPLGSAVHNSEPGNSASVTDKKIIGNSKGRGASCHVIGTQVVWLSQRKRAALYHINRFVCEHASFPSTIEIAERLTGKHVTSWSRGHAVDLFAQLENDGFIERKRKGNRISWSQEGAFTPLGKELAATLSEPKKRSPGERASRTGGGIAEDGGTRFKNMLIPADQLRRDEIVQLADAYGKLGDKVKKAKANGRQKDLRIATFSLEEGRTCDPHCGLKKVCFAGKMSQQKRILYEGLKTDRLVSQAMGNAGRLHYRINTIGDFPTQSFLEAVFATIAVTGSTAFGYTHWQPEHSLGKMVRDLSDWHWDFFSVRTSYEHGSRKPLSERGAVVLQEFHPKLLKEHNAIPCPEETGRARNCGECGACWTTRRNIAFKFH